MGKSPTHPPFICNAQGQRVTRVEDEVVTHFYYTGSALLFTTVNEYVLQTQNILDPSGTIVASKRFEGQRSRAGLYAAADLTTQAAYDMVGKTSPLPRSRRCCDCPRTRRPRRHMHTMRMRRLHGC